MTALAAALGCVFPAKTRSNPARPRRTPTLIGVLRPAVFAALLLRGTNAPGAGGYFSDEWKRAGDAGRTSWGTALTLNDAQWLEGSVWLWHNTDPGLGAQFGYSTNNWTTVLYDSFSWQQDSGNDERWGNDGSSIGPFNAGSTLKIQIHMWHAWTDPDYYNTEKSVTISDDDSTEPTVEGMIVTSNDTAVGSSGTGTNVIYTVTDGFLSNLTSSLKLKFKFLAYDASGLNRATSDPNNYMNYDIGTVTLGGLQDIIATYVSGESTASATASGSSNVYVHSSPFSTAEMDFLFTNNTEGTQGKIKIRVSVPDADVDNGYANDKSWKLNVQAGYLQVVDDDTEAPQLSAAGGSYLRFDGVTGSAGSPVTDGALTNGLSITNRLKDVTSGVYGGATNQFWLFAPTGLVGGARSFDTNPTEGSPQSSYVASQTLIANSTTIEYANRILGVWTCRMFVADFDRDRTGDSLTATSNFPFNVSDDDSTAPERTGYIHYLGDPGNKYWGVGTNGYYVQNQDSALLRRYTITDGDLASAASRTLDLAFQARDTDTGIKRGTGGMNITVGTNLVISANTANFSGSASTPTGNTESGPVSYSTNVWRWTTAFSASDIQKLMNDDSGGGLGTNLVKATLIDADEDRASDSLTTADQTYGYLAVIYDDTNGPVHSTFTGQGRTLSGAVYTNSELGSGLTITGFVQDAHSGVFAGTSNRCVITRDGTQVQNTNFVAGFSDGGALSAAGQLSITSTAVSAAGTYTVTVFSVNYDLDRGASDYQSVTSEFVFTVVETPEPEIGVRGNGVVIADGDSTPDAADDTHYGMVLVAGGTSDHTFTVTNSGGSALTLGSVTTNATGNPGDFIVLTQPSSPLAPGGSTTFSVRFDPSDTGPRTAEITFSNNDGDENPFNFTLGGYGTAPEIAVSGSGNNIADGDGTPSTSDGTDFGDAGVAGDTVTHTFTITNVGAASLTLGVVTTNATGNPEDFIVTQQTTSPLASSNSLTFQVQFNPSAAGVRTTEIQFTNGDSDESPFNFTIQGTGKAAGIYVSPTAYNPTNMLGDAVPNVGFGVTNVGMGTLSYSVTTGYSAGATGWLRSSPGSGSLAAQAGQQHTATFWVTNLPAGVYEATNTIADAAASNTPKTVVFTLTLTNIPNPQSVSATASGNEMVRLKWTEAAGRSVLIVHATGGPADAGPTNGLAAPSAGQSLGNGKVLYNGPSSATESNLEHIVATGSANYYRFYAINNNFYSTGQTVSATVGSYTAAEIVDPFAYTNGVNLGGRTGGQGWYGAWTNAGGYAVISNAFTAISGYPAMSGNVVTGANGAAAFRMFPPRSSGKLYVAVMFRTDSAAASPYSGVSFFNDGSEMIFFGERGGTPANQFGVQNNGTGGASQDTRNLAANTDYLIIGMYDFSAATAYGLMYTNAFESVPATEPGAWHAQAAGTVASLNGIRLASGNGANTRWDEVRVATSWKELLGGAEATWDGGGANANWDNPTNWVGNTTPGTGTNVTFYDAITSGAGINLNGNQTVLGLRFSASADSAISIGPSANTLTINGAGVAVNAGAGAAHSLATVSLGADQSWTNESALSLSITNKLTGSGNLTKEGPGGLILNYGTAANDFTGTLAINAGTVCVVKATALGNTAAGTTVASGGVLEMKPASGTTFAAEPLTLSGTGVAHGGALRSVQNNNTWQGAITLAADARINADANTLTLSGGFNGNAAGRNILFGGAGSLDLTTSGLGANIGQVTKDGAGTLTLSIAGSYSGGTLISNGTLTVGANNVIPDGSAVSVKSGGTFNVNSLTETVGSIEGDGTLSLVNGLLTAGGDNSSTEFRGLVTGAQGYLTKAGTGTLTLTNLNSFGGTGTGGVIVAAGTLSIPYIAAASSLQPLGDSTAYDALTLGGASGGTLGKLLYSGLSASSSKGIYLRETGSGEIEVQAGGTTLTLSDGITGGGALTKSGSGTLTLSGAATHTNTTTVSAGTLIVSGSAADSKVIVSAAGTLLGDGTVGGAKVSGTVNPGNAASTQGSLDATTLELENSGAYRFEIANVAGTPGTHWDLISVGSGSGSVNVNATDGSDFTIAVYGPPAGFSETATYNWTIVDAGNLIGFASNKFTLDLSNFGTSYSGEFTVSSNSGDLVVNYIGPQVPEIAVLGTNFATIASGTITPNPGNGTDYRDLAVSGGTRDHTFYVTNSGVVDLTLSGVTTSGVAAADFIVQSWPSVVSPSARSNLVIRFDPTVTGLRTALVTIANNDSDEGTYRFAIQGTGTWPRIDVNPASFSRSGYVGDSFSVGVFTVTNGDGGTLSYTITTGYSAAATGWMTTLPATGSLGDGAGRSHTNTYSATGLSAGAYHATNTITATGASNTPQTLVSTLTLTALTDPTSVSAVTDGVEMVRLTWTPDGTHGTVMVVARASQAPTDPAQGTGYAMGASVGGGTVIYTGTLSRAEHVVPPSTTNFYKLFTVNNSHYSAGVIVGATNGSYRSGEIVDAFAYTNGIALNARAGGQGWYGSWTNAAGSYTVVTTRFAAISGYYPAMAANAVTGASDTAAFRMFAPKTAGKLYVAVMMRTDNTGSGPYSGVSFYNAGDEMVFYGEGGTPANQFSVKNNGTGGGNTEARQLAANTDYLIIGMYDFTTATAYGLMYTNSFESVPGTEPTTWHISQAGTVASLNGIRLASGSGANTRWDEVRVATNWTELLQLAPPVVTNYVVFGTNINYATDGQITAGTYRVVMHLYSPAGIHTNAFVPNFDIYNPSNVQVIQDRIFTNLTWLDNGRTVIGSNTTQSAVAFDVDPLGAYTARVSVASSNGATLINGATLDNGTVMTFTVNDDDDAAPLRGTAAGPVDGTDRSLVIRTNGATLYRGAGTAANNARYEITDAGLAQVAPAYPFELVISGFDPLSGLSRGTTDANSQMNVDIGSWATDNVSAYYSTGSTNDALTVNANANSVWRWTSFSYTDIGTLFTGTAGSNKVAVTLFDADYDRSGDRSALLNEEYGSLRVTDDDTTVPESPTITYGGLGSKYLVVATNTAADGAVGDREGSGRSTIYRVTDGYLDSLHPSTGLYFAIGAMDVDSSLGRGNSGHTNYITTFSIGTVLHGDNTKTNYNASLSSADGANITSTNVWLFTNQNVFSASVIGSLVSAGTSTVYATIVDADNDRTNDVLVLHTNVGYFAVIDDDGTGPAHSSFTGNGKTLDAGVYSNHVLSGGLVVTGFVQDSDSGVFDGTSNTWSLTRNGAAVNNGSFSCDFSDGGAKSSAGKLEATLAYADVGTAGAYTLTVYSVNYDLDRPGDLNGTTSAFSFTVVAGTFGEIGVSGNATDIANGDNTPSTTDGTEFGNVTGCDGSTATHTFTITNTGNASLTISGITTNGAGDSYFTISGPTVSTIASSNSATFTVQFDPPDTPGLRTAVVVIANNDTDENPFTFSVQGTGLGGPGLYLSPSSLSPSATEGQNAADGNFGVTNIGGGMLQYNVTTTFYGAVANWLSVSPSTGYLANAAGQQHTVSYYSSSLSPGSYTADVKIVDAGTGCYDATNGTRTNKVVLTIGAGASIGLSPTLLIVTSFYGSVTGQPWNAFTLTNSGAVSLYYTNTITYGSVNGWLTVAPTSGTVASGGFQVHTAALTAASVNPGSDYYAYIHVDGNQIGGEGVVTVRLTVVGFRLNEIVEDFNYSSPGATINALNGGNGWTVPWRTNSSPSTATGPFTNTSSSLSVPVNYPAALGDKACADTGTSNDREHQAYRYFAPRSSGKIFVATTIRRHRENNTAGFAGISMMDGDTEMVFFGKRSAVEWFGMESVPGGVNENSTYGLYQNSTYLIVGLYDFDRDILQAQIYVSGDTLPLTEPTSWRLSNNVVTAFSEVDGIRIAGKDVGLLCFDEIRAAATWEELINATPTEPNTDSTAMQFSNTATNSMTVSWTVGNGQNRIVVARLGAAVNWTPSDGSDYAANTNYSGATDQGSGNKVVYNGNAASVNVSGLSENTNWYFKVFEYNGAGSSANYYTSGSPLASNHWTLISEPANHVTGFAAAQLSSTQISNYWTAASGTPAPDGYLLIGRLGEWATNRPVDGVVYTNGQAIDGDTVVGIVTPGSATFTNTAGLSPCEAYYFAIFPFRRNTAATETYNYKTGGTVPTNTASTACSAPTLQASNLTFLAVQSTSMKVSWQKGNGQYRILVVSTNEISTLPQDGSNYTASATMGAGSRIGTSYEYVTFNGTGEQVTVSGLATGATYRFWVFDFNGSAGAQVFNTSPAYHNPATNITASFVTIYESFDYSEGQITDVDVPGSPEGWTNDWSQDYSVRVVNYNVSDSQAKCYPHDGTSKWITLDSYTGGAAANEVRARRNFPGRISGKLYAGFWMGYNSGDFDHYVGLQFMSGGTEAAFIGKNYDNSSNTLGITVGGTQYNSNDSLSPGGSLYLVVAMYDFESDCVKARRYDSSKVATADPEEGEGWDVEVDISASPINRIDGIRVAKKGKNGDADNAAWFDEIRVGATWKEVMVCDWENATDVTGPDAELIYIGTNVAAWFADAGRQVTTNLTDAELSSVSNVDFAVLWTDSSGIFLTNSVVPQITNKVSSDGRVMPNWDPLSEGAATNKFGLDVAFGTNFFGRNGSTVITAYQVNAFVITNVDFNTRYFVTVSAEDNAGIGDCSVAAPNSGDNVNCLRNITVNEALRFYVTDDDLDGPTNGAGGLIVMTNGASTYYQDYNGLRLSYVHDGVVTAGGFQASFNAYDKYSGIQRSASGPVESNMHVAIQRFTTNNYQQYSSARSSTVTTNASSTSVWAFAASAVGYTQVSSMWGADAGQPQGDVLAVQASIPDSDGERATDISWFSNLLFGYVSLLDDDEYAPSNKYSGFTFGDLDNKIFVVATNASPVAVGNRAGSFSNTCYNLTDEELVLSGTRNLRFGFGAMDESGLGRGTSGTTNTVMSFSVISPANVAVIQGNFANYNASLSSASAGNIMLTSVWSFADGDFTEALVNNLMTNGLPNEEYANTNMVYLTVPDGDQDRDGDQSALRGQQVGLISVRDDDRLQPSLGSMNAMGSGGIQVLSDLIISEYVEGSSNNKYLEIFNGTGGSVDLSAYCVGIFKRQQCHVGREQPRLPLRHARQRRDLCARQRQRGALGRDARPDRGQRGELQRERRRRAHEEGRQRDQPRGRDGRDRREQLLAAEHHRGPPGFRHRAHDDLVVQRLDLPGHRRARRPGRALVLRVGDGRRPGPGRICHGHRFRKGRDQRHLRAAGRSSRAAAQHQEQCGLHGAGRWRVRPRAHLQRQCQGRRAAVGESAVRRAHQQHHAGHLHRPGLGGGLRY